MVLIWILDGLAGRILSGRFVRVKEVSLVVVRKGRVAGALGCYHTLIIELGSGGKCEWGLERIERW